MKIQPWLHNWAKWSLHQWKCDFDTFFWSHIFSVFSSWLYYCTQFTDGTAHSYGYYGWVTSLWVSTWHFDELFTFKCLVVTLKTGMPLKTLLFKCWLDVTYNRHHHHYHHHHHHCHLFAWLPTSLQNFFYFFTQSLKLLLALSSLFCW